MVGSSKILTVKYGTFSCTAEGFEDPLGAVKDTTHFFRHVVRDDRLFGAEPPQFDAALAEEMLRGQLAADLRDGHLTVRPEAGSHAFLPGEAVAGDTNADSAATEGRPAAEVSEHTHEDSAAASERDQIGTEHATAPAETTDGWTTSPAVARDDEWVDAATRTAVPPPAPATPDDTVAAKLARIRAVVGAPASGSWTDGTEDHADATDLAADHAAEDCVDNAPGTDAVSGHVRARRDGAVEAVAHAERASLDAAPAWQTLPDHEGYEQDVPADTLTRDAIPAADDKIHPIKECSPEPDEVSEVEQEPARVVECDDAETSTDDLDALLAGLRAQADAQTPVPPDETDDAAPVSLSGQDDATTDVVASIEADEADAVPPEEIAAPEAWPADPTTVAGADLVFAEVDAEDETAPQVRENEFLSVQDDIPDDVASDDVPEEHAEDDSGEPGIDLPPPGAGQRHGETEHDAVDRSAEDEDDADPWAEDASRETARAPALGELSDRLRAQSSLSDEDEEELVRELAAVRAELQGTTRTAPNATPFRLDNPILSDDETRIGETGDAGTDEGALEDAETDAESLRPEESFIARASAGARKAVRLASPARALLTERTVGDNDTSRLLNQTDAELDEPEGNRRRSAIAHLRAAVAATRADRALQPDQTDAETERYREDLAKVVRPRRPKVLRSIRTERPAPEPQGAPLQLVSQQRVDNAPAGPVRPRRVSIAEDIGPAPDIDAADDAGGGFADYAASVGATRLPDLLEAAAAYMAFVEGRDQFSRPQLMTVLQRVDGGTATREERLRSFGRLLRDGKIEKTRGGRFTASDSIGFRPDARQAG